MYNMLLNGLPKGLYGKTVYRLLGDILYDEKAELSAGRYGMMRAKNREISRGSGERILHHPGYGASGLSGGGVVRRFPRGDEHLWACVQNESIQIHTGE